MARRPNDTCKQSDHARRLERGRRRPVAPATPLFSILKDPPGFADALRLQIERHGESAEKLWRAIVSDGDKLDPATIVAWRNGKSSPRALSSMRYLKRIEQRYALPDNYFRDRLPHPCRAVFRDAPVVLSAAEHRRLAWHLPDDFEGRSLTEQQEILAWVRRVIVTGATDYRVFQRQALRQRYALRFPRTLLASGIVSKRRRGADRDVRDELVAGSRSAPPVLVAEMRDLLRFKTQTLTEPGYARRGVWNDETAAQKLEHLSLMFGAMIAAPSSEVAGLGASLARLSLAYLVFPSVWDWYVAWRERRRGFFTAWEIDMLSVAASLTASPTGWLRQTPKLAERLTPLRGLVSKEDVDQAQADWGASCDRMHAHARVRAKEIERVARVHRDPFEPILPVLEAPSPLSEYRKIADEIVRLLPDAGRYPKAAAEARRSFLMIRLGLHLGLRQKNLRQLLITPRGAIPSTERQLIERRRGELRWSERDGGWEVFIPAVAFKNAHSTFFSGRPFRLVLPDLANLYEHIDLYVGRDRPILLAGARDPRTFFVKSLKRSSANAEYDQTTFYEAWRLAIQRYGVYNPWTKRGAVPGLLPHGPHNVRDVLATHILKQTGSFEQASYAIQDTPDIVAKHYGRFLPENKAALAARILNQVWEQ